MVEAAVQGAPGLLAVLTALDGEAGKQARQCRDLLSRARARMAVQQTHCDKP